MLYAPFTDKQASGFKSSLFFLFYLVFIFPLMPACANQQHAAHQHEDGHTTSTMVDKPAHLMRWSDPATWETLGQAKPVEGDEVNIPAGAAILLDNRSEPLYPRWAAYFSFWCGILFLPGALASFFLSGPFAWNGILAFWLPLVVFFGWYIVMFFVLLKVIKEQPAIS